VTQVLVLGGGFGGLAAAAELRATLPDDAEVVLVDRRDGFAMGFAKLWDLAGQRPLADGTRSLHDLTARGIRFVQAEVRAIEAAARRVETAAGTFSPDALVVALGSRPAPQHRAWLQAPGAHDLYDVVALPAMRAALAAIDGGRVVVSILGGPFKCPPAPYEAALIVDRLLRDREVRGDVEVVVTTPQPMTLPVAGVDASVYVAGHLDEVGVELRSGHRVVDVATRTAGGGVLRFAEDLPSLDFDLLLGVPADAPLEVVGASDLVGEDGWIRPDPATFRTPHEGVYAVGDCTVVPTATRSSRTPACSQPRRASRSAQRRRGPHRCRRRRVRRTRVLLPGAAGRARCVRRG
jgi:sulfide:quinone oxidoreductase